MSTANPQVALPYSRTFFGYLLLFALAVSLWKFYKYKSRLRKRTEVCASDSYLDNLPYEIIEEIMSYLDLPSLLAAAQVSPHWHNYPCINLAISNTFQKASEQKKDSFQFSIYKDIKPHIELVSNRYTSSYKPQWHLEDEYLAKRLNKTLFDITLDTVIRLRQRVKDAKSYIVKTSLKWLREDEKFIYFETTRPFYGELKIAKDLVPMKHVGEEYEAIFDLDTIRPYHQEAVVSNIHRFRVKTFLDWRLRLLMMIGLVYGPVLVMDVSDLLCLYSTSASYFVHYLGVITSYTLVAVFFWCCKDAARNIFVVKRLIASALLGVLGSGCLWLAILYPDHWRNNGLCWIIGGCIEGYGWLFRQFWLRRHQFGLKITSAIISISTILFMYAVDWNLVIEYVVTNRIWKTIVINLIHIWMVWVQYSVAQFIIESILDNLKPYWGYFSTVDRKMLQQAIPAQILIATLCSFYAPAGFANLP